MAIEILDYDIVTAKSPYILSEKVRAYMKDGWRPWGDVFVHQDWVNQTMVKVEE